MNARDKRVSLMNEVSLARFASGPRSRGLQVLNSIRMIKCEPDPPPRRLMQH